MLFEVDKFSYALLGQNMKYLFSLRHLKCYLYWSSNRIYGKCSFHFMCEFLYILHLHQIKLVALVNFASLSVTVS